MINNFRTPNIKIIRNRAKQYGIKHGGIFSCNNIKQCGYDLDMEVYGIWLEAINICALRSMIVPNEILDDFYYTNKGEE